MPPKPLKNAWPIGPGKRLRWGGKPGGSGLCSSICLSTGFTCIKRLKRYVFLYIYNT
jgi:hypothetical protein